MADAGQNNNDKWAVAVHLLTGYQVPDRTKVFDDLQGNDDIPLMHVRLHKVGGPQYVSGFISSGGANTHNTDYTIPFYGPASGSATGEVSEGKSLNSYRAYITFLGVGKGVPSGDDNLLGIESTSKVLKDKGGW
ncbi:hypothetical protein ABCR94_26310, partial [Streptomyces sp. 21So2-11]